ncbi:MAG: class I SAM-dependent methyltransferase [Chrysiogenales bacterium]|nr:MAG: class I SAM-dependent methyltransferase [Chrysiogenales bacterium]
MVNAEKKHRICPVEHAGVLDFNFRKLLQNPQKILRPYIREGMTVLDLGCGPGFFTMEMARLVGETGKVIAADLQQGMLEKVKEKIQNTVFADIIELHQCLPDRVGLSQKFDFILVFYMLHEVPDQEKFLREIQALLKPQGRILLVEPSFHVSRHEFLESIALMNQAGFAVAAQPRILFSRTVALKNNGAGE